MSQNISRMGYEGQRSQQVVQSPSRYQGSQHGEVLINNRNYIVPSNNFYSNSNSQMQNLNFSRLNQHNVHYHTDKLYDPLRNTVLHPQNIKYHQKQIPNVVRHSYLTHDYKILSKQEADNLQRNLYIPKDVDLAQTDHFYKVKDKQFVAVNTQTKVIGKPVTPLELERIKQQGVKKSMVVYDLKERVQEVDPVTTYVPPAIEVPKKKQYKYNLYSMIDEPMNWVRQMGCSGARWCVPNQVIASKNEPQSLKWIQ